jgi:hypothetical protein
MAAKKKPAAQPSLPPEKAVELVQQQIEAGERLQTSNPAWDLHHDGQDYVRWKTLTEGILRRINPSWENGFFNAASVGGGAAQIAKLRGYYDLLKIEVDHPTPAAEPEGPKAPTSIHLHGPNPRVNINSVDSSTNTAITSSMDWSALRSALEAVQDQALRQQAVQVALRLESQVGERGYMETYKELIALLADHMTILLPFLPALAAMLQG